MNGQKVALVRMRGVRSATGARVGSCSRWRSFAPVGCASSGGEFSAMMFADPGKYQYKTCDEIAAAAVNAAARQKQLRELIAKAEQGAAGTVVSTIAYRGEYRTVSEELHRDRGAPRAPRSA